MARVDVVVVAYNSRAHLRAAIEPLLPADWVHLIVVDNASPDDSAAVVADLPVTVVREPSNRGFGAGCNAGWRRGAAPFVLFLNPDTIMGADALAELADALEADEGTGVVGPRILTGDGDLDHSIRRFPRLRSTFAQAVFAHRLRSRATWADEVVRDADRYAAPGEADWLSGACLLVRRDLLERLGGFDERFFMYCEDTDLCKRAWDAGAAVRFEPAATCLHVGGRSAPRSALLPTLAESRVLYASRHRTRAGALVERAGVVLGAVTHALVGRGGRAARAGHLAAAGRALRA